MLNKFQTFLLTLFTLAVPAPVLAHPGVGPAEWPGHVLSQPVAALDHWLASFSLLLGFGLLVHKASRKGVRVVGAAMVVLGILIISF